MSCISQYQQHGEIMKKFVFQVEQHAITPNSHSWVAIDQNSKKSIDLKTGGVVSSGGNSVVKYPEIQEYLFDVHQVNVILEYKPQLDNHKINPDGTSVWTFHRQQAEVTVHDILRVVASITIQQ
jgi:hypothetical protein